MMVAMITGSFGYSSAPRHALRHREPALDHMPSTLEARFALSALPRPMRAHSAVLLLDPAKGYQLSQKGTSGVTCLVQRTAWEYADYRSDIYVPRCYDAEGARTFLNVLIDVAALRAAGASPIALKHEIERRYRTGRYKPPVKAGLSYMISPVMRTWLPDSTVHTMSGPHVMFYAPNVTSKDIGAMPDSLPRYPFALQEGIPEQSYLVQMLGEMERSRVLTDEKELLDAVCSYRAVLCLPRR
jgi:hypothetical protein